MPRPGPHSWPASILPAGGDLAAATLVAVVAVATAVHLVVTIVLPLKTNQPKSPVISVVGMDIIITITMGDMLIEQLPAAIV